MDWFRMYSEIVYDPKVIRLSDKEHRAWVNMLAIASMNGGILPSAEDIALHLRTTEQRAASLLSKLCNRGFFDKTEHGIEPHNWKTRQYVSDCSTPRVRKHRETFPKRPRNVSETPSEQNRTETEQKQNRAGWADHFEGWWKILSERHPLKSGSLDSARMLVDYLSQSTNPEREMELIDSRHQEYCATWTADPSFVPQLDSWVRKHGWLDPPRQPKQTRKLRSLVEELTQ